MAVELKVPAVGESITEVHIGAWHAEKGSYVDADANVVELETDKATFDVPAPINGIITEILKKVGEQASVGEVIGYMEPAEKPAGSDEGSSDSGGSKSAQTSSKSEPAAASASDSGSGNGNGGTRVMPAAERLLAEKGLSAGDVKATGPGGRLLKEDVLSHRPAVADSSTNGQAGRHEDIVPMSPIRQRIAERLVSAQHNAALLTTFNEIDMANVMAFRKQYQDTFVKKYGIKLGFMSFFVKATIDALNAFPQINAELRDKNLVYRNYYDIGVAIGGGKGLVVPIIRNAERLSFAEIELTIAEFAKRAQANKIGLDELQGGTFTITNGGVYGSLLSTPIVNPPQSGVLGMHGIVDRPVAVNGEVVIRPMMYVALTYDHRVVDGKEAVSFLRRIKEVVEDPARMLMEV
ncbi:Dihydrolipoyllysine-residue succinyltransferase component of 2-oxoglutarate dehydrogenase complex [Polystyrenella longa]|uniref:Dihydrolipoyllysine-residue succinyltransferase component of 2-oxoglutarate dehydrogenase complex n=1 Tax=Polystyrenella longa TaxID=2528007 RepID=A0A518CP10_9PLAN|nr:2-oxoglutarate dehydrogenase complex dihydrolipoyllysine-residue succinyltransferase [Polystyrenella longa]QDU80934.1 Dihydrolipoyllysine-residue succinyltransferase component of 2-oxoglutarate dehydrogenase complex [Polystyrenella longa]